MPEPANNPSSAEAPDLDWSQVRETVMMLSAAVAQIQHSLRDGGESVQTLTDSFTSMVGNARVIELAAASLPQSDGKASIVSNCAAITEKINEAIVAFQFYDKLTQRLEHVAHSLDALAALVAEPQRLYNPFEWRGLQEKIKSKYTVAADRRMFEAILGGASVEQALALAERENARKEEDIELF